ncbi:MAG: rhodanese-like domain-containing protein [Deltaproteobacteria bacterium]|nr:rhodanese-like domain-containing protein [Deltaproteobacteria bacterium]
MIRRSLLGFIALALLASAAPARADEGFTLMPADEVQKNLGKAGFHVYDVNVPELWKKHRVPGAVHVVGKDLAPLLPADRAESLVFYCSNPK